MSVLKGGNVIEGVVGLKVISALVNFDDFTDGGGAVGTYELDEQLPVGAIIQATKVKVPAGFAGDVSAVLQIGDGTDVDRYNAGTPSVFAAAANGIQMGVPSGDKYHDVAATITLTVTTDADFSSVSAGQLEVSLIYLETE